MKYRFKFLVCMVLFISILCSFGFLNFSVLANDIQKENENLFKNITELTEEQISQKNRFEYGYAVDPCNRIGTVFDNPNRDTNVLPSKYDPRDDIDFVSDERSQANTSLCWLYAPINGTEILTAKTFGSKFELSKAYGSVALSNLMIPSNHIGGGYYNRDVMSSGFYSVALQYLTNWNTPLFNDETIGWNSLIAETDYPITKLSSNGMSIDNDYLNSTPLLNVDGAVYIDNYVGYSGNERDSRIQNIKNAVYEYGGVSVPHRVGIQYFWYKGETIGFNYFASESTTYEYLNGHSVLIVGWDDNYSKDNFKTPPSQDGAWLVKNSTTENATSFPYYWLSYNEHSIGFGGNKLMTVTDIHKTTDKEYMLSYDYMPITKSNVSFNDDINLCNVYNVSGFSNTYDSINKVMFYYCAEKAVDYEIRIIPLSNNGSIPVSFDGYSVLRSGTVQGEGYTTVELNNPYSIESIDRVAVIVTFIPQHLDSNCYIPYESTYTLTQVNSVPEVNSGESFFGLNNQNNSLTWTDCTQTNQYSINANLVIRPVLQNNDASLDTISVTPTQIEDNGFDEDIYISQMNSLFNIHTFNGRILYENNDYVRTTSGITLKQSFIESLNGEFTRLCLDFTNDIEKEIVINPKSIITNVNITGEPIVGDTLYSSLVGNPPRDNYEVSYQWQYSLDGSTWLNISGATSTSFVIDNSLLGKYLRLKVDPISNSCNVESGNISSPTSIKVVVLGDVNLDSSVTISDATLVQKYLANLITFNSEQELAADYDRDGVITIDDVSLIQRKALGLI